MVLADAFSALLSTAKALISDPNIKQAIADDVALLEDKAAQGAEALEQHVATWFAGHYALPAPEQPAVPVAAEPVPAEPVATAPEPVQVPAEPVAAEPVPAEPVPAEPVPAPVAEPVPAEPVPADGGLPQF